MHVVSADPTCFHVEKNTVFVDTLWLVVWNIGEMYGIMMVNDG